LPPSSTTRLDETSNAKFVVINHQGKPTVLVGLFGSGKL
jgi:hypothetical protein